MKREAPQKSDVRIRWPNDAARLSAIIKSGRCPSDLRPHHAKKSAKVALIDSVGRVLLLFTLQQVDENKSVIAANGKRKKNGCELVAKPGTVRYPSGNDRKKLDAIKHPAGAIAYFEATTGESVWYGGASTTITAPSPTKKKKPKPKLVALEPYHADNTGKKLSQPEAKLVGLYRKWIGGKDDRFKQGRLASAALSIDLFVVGVNLLIEAKAYIDRDSIRMAVGQLQDYRHFMPRRPKLAVLVPARPAIGVLRFLDANRIVCIWKTGADQFRDSYEGRYSVALRREVT